ncbi:hypothetical protein [Streptomyces sp. MUM 16J]|uniref:hypothetical protein n=1 Tax=Streptomyces sp. MUM 16J TaxID=2791988 RepID=UPI001F047439|nr:hypothetical protein [Streptomyces sp. MUM 16J]MCH0559171.1 hypothetical protein [Streptomyces sp. MUM 16J]
MDPVLERLRARTSAARSRVEGLRSRIAVLEKELAEEEERLSRWAVAEEAVSELLAEDDDADGEETSVAAAGAETSAAPVAAAAAGRVVVSAPVTRADGTVLGGANEDVVLALASAGRPLRARPICEAVGWETDHRPVERMRVRLKRLVKQGWLTEDQVGLFAIAPGVGDPPGRDVQVNGTAVDDV